jgi:hypothetical protein
MHKFGKTRKEKCEIVRMSNSGNVICKWIQCGELVVMIWGAPQAELARLNKESLSLDKSTRNLI